MLTTRPGGQLMHVVQERSHARHGGRPPRAVSEQISRRILLAAAELFLRDGYEGTSMDAVAGRAGLSKRTLYTRFPAKAGLFEAVVGDVIESKLQLLEVAHAATTPFREQLLAFAEQLLSIVIVPEVVGLERVVTGEAKQFPDVASRLHQRLGDHVIRLLCELIGRFEPEGGRDETLIRKDAEIFLAMVILPPLRKAVLFQTRPSVDDVDRAFSARAVEIFTRGMRA